MEAGRTFDPGSPNGGDKEDAPNLRVVSDFAMTITARLSLDFPDRPQGIVRETRSLKEAPENDTDEDSSRRSFDRTIICRCCECSRRAARLPRTRLWRDTLSSFPFDFLVQWDPLVTSHGASSTTEQMIRNMLR
jgi:hypothetical protein